MANLEISINCLCLFVPDPQKNIMHVLMPAPHTHHPHFVKVRHLDLFPEGRSMEGWVLELGGAVGKAETHFRPHEPPKNGDVVFDITRPDCKVARTALDDAKALVSRIELRAGRIKELKAEATCEFNGKRVAATYQVTWEIENITDEQLSWRPLRKPTNEPPFRTLSELDTGKGPIKFEIFHVSTWPLPDGGDLNPQELKDHFRAYYHLCGDHHPDESRLPQNPQKIEAAGASAAPLAFVPSYSCVNARGSFE